MSIQWFPGHMAKAKRQVAENLPLVDVVVEVVDARCPAASSNHDLLKVIKDKQRVVILNKADLAEPGLTEAWMAELRRQGAIALALDAMHGNPREVLKYIREAFAPKLDAIKAKGRLPRPARAMVVGIPNVGKSSVINKLIGQKRAATGDKPGITKGKQWVRVGNDVELLDVPGILPPKFEDQRDGVLLAAVGCIKEDIYDKFQVVEAILPLLWQKVPHGLQERLGLPAEPLALEEALEQTARHRGLLRAGAAPDTDGAAGLLLREVREGRLGRLTLQAPVAPEPAT